MSKAPSCKRRQRARAIGSLDTLIAAHALALGAVLATHDTRESKRAPKLVIEDWA